MQAGSPVPTVSSVQASNLRLLEHLLTLLNQQQIDRAKQVLQIEIQKKRTQIQTDFDKNSNNNSNSREVQTTIITTTRNTSDSVIVGSPPEDSPISVPDESHDFSRQRSSTRNFQEFVCVDFDNTPSNTTTVVLETKPDISLLQTRPVSKTLSISQTGMKIVSGGTVERKSTLVPSQASNSNMFVHTPSPSPPNNATHTVTTTPGKRSSFIITPGTTNPIKSDNQYGTMGRSNPGSNPQIRNVANNQYGTVGSPKALSQSNPTSPDTVKEPYPHLNTPSTLPRPGKAPSKRESTQQATKPLPKPPGSSPDLNAEKGGSRIVKKQPPPKFATIVVKKFCPRSEKHEKEFNMVVMEIVQTERDYVRDLQIILDVYIIPLEKGNIIPKATVTSLFSNWRALLGINRELLNQMEILLEKLQTQQTQRIVAEANTLVGCDDSDQNKLLIRISFSSDHASKIIAIPNSYTGRQVVDLAISKVISSLPFSEQENFREKYVHCELYDETKAYNLDNNFVQQLSLKPGVEPPQFSIRRSTKQPTNIGECFLHMAIYLKMYSEYCSNQVAAAKLLDKLKEENYNFFNFIDCCQFDNPLCRKLDLTSFLIIPMQRVCKYPLLLKRLLDCTPENHLDYNSLTEASVVLSEAVQAINDKKKEAECNEKMFNLQNKIVCPMKDLQIFAPSRRYISDGKVQYYEGTGLVDSVYFIFNDLLVITSLPDDKGRYRKKTHFETLTGLIDSELENVPLTVKITVGEESIFLTFEGIEEKQQFLNTFTNTLNELRRDRYNTWVTTQKAKGFAVSKTYESWLDTVLATPL